MPQGKKWSKDDEKWLFENYPTSRPEEVEARLGRKNHAINEYARKRGIYKSGEYRHRKITGDLSVLLDESLETYYWIGFILADGCFQKTNQLNVTLSLRDEEHLLKLAKYLNTHIRYINDKNQAVLAIQNAIIVPKIMKKYGIPYNKTYDCVQLPLLTNDKFLSLLCGFIDGDGSRGSCNFRLENYKTWLPFYQTIEKYLGVPITIRLTPTKNTVTAYINKKTSVSLVDFQQRHALPTLERKWYPFVSKSNTVD